MCPKSSRRLVALSLLAALTFACKERPPVSTLRDTLVTETLAGEVGTFLRTAFPGGPSVFTLHAKTGGPVDLRVTIRPLGGAVAAAGAPTVTIADAKGNAVLAATPLFANGAAGSTFFSGALYLDTDAGSVYTVTLDPGGTFAAGKGFGSIAAQYVAGRPTDPGPSGQQLLSVDSGRVEDSLTFSGKATYPLQIQAAQDGLTTIVVSGQILRFDGKLRNENLTSTVPAANLGVTAKLNFTDTTPPEGGTKHVSTPLAVTGTKLNGTVAYRVSGTTYQAGVAFTGLLDGDFVALQFTSQLLRDSTGAPITAPLTLVGPQIQFNMNLEAEGLYGPGPFAVPVLAAVAHEAKLDLNTTVIRFANASQNPLPDNLAVTLLDASKTQVAGAQLTGSTSGDNNYSGSIVANLAVGGYQAVYKPELFEASDYLRLQAKLTFSDLSMPDPDSTFEALIKEPTGAAVVVPPAGAADLPTTWPYAYNADLSVPPNQPFGSYTPAALPHPLAMVEVLKAMEQTRLLTHQRLPQGAVRSADNVIDQGTIQACLANVAAHWSDITMHYYCQLGEARSCFTGDLRAGKSRLDAWSDCSKTDDDFIKWIVPTQSSVFEYLMLAQTYAFDQQQQQDVINAFYHVHPLSSFKDVAGGLTALDQFRQECNARRPRRAIDPQDGTHCEANKTYQQPMASAGR